MISRSLNSAAMASTGYGPSHSNLPASPVKMFSGKPEHFEDFKFSLLLVLSEHNDAVKVIEDGAGFLKLHKDAQERLAAHEKLRSSSDPAQIAVFDGYRRECERLNSLGAAVARLLYNRIPDHVSRVIRDCVSVEERLNPVSIWRVLSTNYAQDESVRRLKDNFEERVLEMLDLKPASTTSLLVYARTLLERAMALQHNAKVVGSGRAVQVISALAARRLVDNMAREMTIYRPVYDKYLALIVGSNDLLALSQLRELVLEIERVDVAAPTAPRGQPHHQRGGGGGARGSGGGPAGGAASGARGGAAAPGVRGGGGAGWGSKRGGKQGRGVASVSEIAGGDDVVDGDVQQAQGGSVKSVDAYLSVLVTVSVAKGMPETSKVFLVDSGATHHCVRERKMFSVFKPGKHVVRVADGNVITAQGKGDVIVDTVDTTGGTVQLVLHDVFWIPKINNNIFSTNKFAKASPTNSATLGAQKLLHCAGGTVIELSAQHGLVWLLAAMPGKKVVATATVPGPQPTATVPTMTLQLFHERMGHANYKSCVQVARDTGVKLTHVDMSHVCEVCETSKQRKKPIRDLAGRTAVAPGAMLHCDIKGPLDSAYNRSKYALVVVDEATRVCVVKDMKSKDGVVEALKACILALKRVPGGAKFKIGQGTMLHSDSEAVLKSVGMMAFLSSQHIAARASPPHTHERNGIVERAIQTLFDTVRALLQQTCLDEKFWPLALHHAAYLRNRLPTQALGGRVPLQELCGKHLSVSKLRTFGCKVFVRVDDSGRTALEPRARAGVYVGHSDLSDSHRVLVRNATRWDVVETIHCTVDEAVPGLPVAAEAGGATQGVATSQSTTPASTASAPARATSATASAPAPTAALTAAASPAANVTAKAAKPAQPHAQPAPLLAGRDPLLDDFDDDEAVVSSLVMGGSGSEPRSYREAMRGAESQSWGGAVRTELDSLVDNGTFEEVVGEVGKRKVLSSRWVFTKKHDADGGTRFKARLVARGDHQRAGIDFGEVYAPVTHSTTVRTMFALANALDYELDQMDAVTAFLNSPLEDDELYLHLPDGYQPQTQGATMLRLRKSLYGLKQAPRHWNKMLSDWLLSYGLQQSDVDPCLFFILGKLWVAIWVDDFLLMAVDVTVKDKFKSAIAAQFKMRDLGAIKQFLGMVVTRDRAARTLTITSIMHIDEMLQRYGMADAKPAHTPLEHLAVLRECVNEADCVSASVPYRGVVGSLLYVAMWTRPDIAFAVSQIARFQSKPSVHHWECAKRILRYLKGTRQLGLTYSTGVTGQQPVLRGYVDASWGEDLDTRRSQSGYVFMLGGAAISWKSKLQHTVALSSTEAEYLSLGTATGEALYLRNLLGDLHPAAAGPVTLYEDNQSTIKQASNLQSSERTKHIDIRHHFIKSHVANGDIALEYIPTAEQPADALTKSLDRVKVSSFRQFTLGSE